MQAWYQEMSGGVQARYQEVSGNVQAWYQKMCRLGIRRCVA